MGTAAARNGVSSRDSFDSIQSADSPPLYQPASASSSGSADSAPDASKCTVPECSACAETGSQPCVEGMRRVLGDVHIRGVSAGKLHPGKTQRQEAPFANCTVVLDRPLSVVVIGSGFAGFSAAIACTRQGFSVTLLEKGSGLSPHGDLISFCPNANNILARWGLEGLMRERSAEGGSMIINDSNGCPANTIDMDEIAKGYGSPMFQGHRAQFLGVFGVEARVLGVEIVPYTEVIDVIDNLDRPACITSDGRVFKGDVVLVADGCHSTLRRNVFGTETKESHGGYGIHRSLMKVSKNFRKDPKCAHLLDGKVRVWLGEDCHAIFAPIDKGKQMSLSITHVDIDKKASFSWKDMKSMEEVKPFVQGWDESLLAAMKYFGSGLHWKLFHHEPLHSWISANGRVAFLGDAIHTYLPTSMQGATASVEDGATLALCLALAGGKSTDVSLALRVYQTLRKETVRQRAESGVRQREIWHRYSKTRDEKDARLLAIDFFGEDAEYKTLECFEMYAVEEQEGFRIDETNFSRAAKNAGF